MADADAQLASFIERFSSDNQALIHGARAVLKVRLSGAHELVYDNYNFFVIGYCTTERPSDCILSLAASAKGVSLSFYRGASLEDPGGLLQGSGTQNRFLRLESPAILTEPAVDDLIKRAVAGAPVPLVDGVPGRLIIRSISARQRPRR